MDKPVEVEQKPSRSGLECLVGIARRFGIHPTVEQMVRENLLASENASVEEIMKCAGKLGLKSKHISADWHDVAKLGQALPAMIRLKNGYFMTIVRVGTDQAGEHVVLEDPNAGEKAPLVIDRARFENGWDGTLILIKRNYDIRDEEQPFSFGMIAALMFRDKRLVRDVAICALVLSIVALAPIMFWRLMADRVLSYKNFSTFYVLCTGFGVLVVFEMLFGAMRRYLVLHISGRIDVKLSTYVFDKVLNLPIDFFERTSVGLIARDMREVFKVRQLLTGQLFNTVLDSMILLIFIPVMFYYSPILTLVVLGSCGLIAIWIILMLPIYRQKSAQVIKAEGAMGSFMIQTLNGMRTIKTLALDARQRHHWDVLVATAAKYRFAEGVTGNLINSVVTPIERFVVSGSLAIGVYMAISSNEAVYLGSIFAFMMLANRVAAPLVQLAQMVQQLDEAMASVAVVSRLVNQAPEEGRSGHGVRSPLKGNIEFSNVRFKYKGAVSPALDGVTFQVPQGTSLGIMGRSGSGKTTVTRLLQRLHSDYDGLIKIDGIDVREFDVDHLRSSLGVVLQDNFLFSASIRENITIAKPDATFEDVVRAARLAGAEEFIEKLPRGYETFINEGSSNLSGGQRQRLAIARALITDPKILIMDEATSALDAESEAIVNANLDRIADGRTLIVISHRLSSLVKSDAILVLERGRVSDMGKHSELLQRSEIYSHLWATQNKDTDSNVVPLRNRR